MAFYYCLLAQRELDKMFAKYIGVIPIIYLIRYGLHQSFETWKNRYALGLNIYFEKGAHIIEKGNFEIEEHGNG